MSITYTPTTNFAGKDSLPSNDSNKVVKGAEFTTEFTAIQSAFALAAPSSTPTFTGTATFDNVTASTVSLGSVTASSLTVNGAFTSPGIDDNATSTAITIDSSENVGIGAFGTNTLTTITGPVNSDVVKLDGSAGVSDRHLIFSNSSNSQLWDMDAEGGASGLGVLSFSTNGSEGMRISSQGNVGIGTTSPTTKATIAGDVNNSSLPIGSASASDAQLTIANNNASSFGLGSELLFQVATSGSAPVAGIRGSYTGYNASENFSGALTFGTQANASTGIVDRMTISSSGNVGIGTSDPVSIMHVKAAGSSGTNVLSLENDSNKFDFRLSGTSLLIRDGADDRIAVDVSGNVGIGTTTPNAGGDYHAGWGLSLGADRTFIGTTQGGDSVLGGAGGSAYTALHSNGTERMRIDASGNVGIGTTNPLNTLQVRNTTNSVVLADVDPTIALNHQSGTYTAGHYYNVLGFARANSNGTTLGASIAPVMDSAGNTDALSFGVATSGSTSVTERMRIDATGNVGIRTTNPAAYNANANDLVVGQAGVSGNRGVTIASGSTSLGTLAFANGPSGSDLTRQFIRADHSDGAMLFATSAGEKMRIDSSGNVGIGTDSPEHKVEIAGSGATAALALTRTDNNTVGGVGSIQFNASDGHALAGISASGDGNNEGAHIDFRTTSAATDSSVYNVPSHMRLDSSGNLLVGTSEAVGNGQNNAGLLLNSFGSDYGQMRSGRVSTFTGSASQIAFYHAGSYIGGLNTTTTTTALVGSSDERLKENIVDAPAGVLDGVKVRSFDWKATGEHVTHGLVAQELNEVIPSAAHYNEEEDHWGVDYSALVPMLVKEIQDLKAEVEALKNA